MKIPTWEFEAIGTHWRVHVFDDVSFEVNRLAQIFSDIQNRIGEFDQNYSRFRKTSLVLEMAEKAGVYELPADAERMFALYRKVYDATGGLVTPLIGQVLVDAGYDRDYTLRQKAMTVPKAWDDVLAYDFPHVVLKEPVMLDFGAAGKGYLVDIVSELLEKNGITSYCVDAGGDMRHRSTRNETFRVGLENPEQTNEAIGVATICNQSLCASAGNRRRWPGAHGMMHHIIDPRKLKSPEHILALWVTADTTILADILATALFFVSPETMLEHFDFEYLILNADHSVTSSPAFPAEIFTKSDE